MTSEYYYYHHQSDPLTLSSSCPYSTSLVRYASKLGGTIDPDFLAQFRITDQKLAKSIENLKSIPLNFEVPLSNFPHQENLYFDIDSPYDNQYYDSWGFKQHNTWLGSSEQLNLTSSYQEDIIIDLL